MSFELVTLKSGVISLRALENRETFHPVTGPRIEANLLHVEQQRLVVRSAQYAASGETFVIWDVGLGAAANAIAVIDALQSTSARVDLHSFDKTTAPLEFALSHSKDLGYFGDYEQTLRNLIHDHSIQLNPTFHWKLHRGDFCRIVSDPTLPAPHAIIYDPYSPMGNPEMWTLQHFTQLRSRMTEDSPCLWTNYTRSTAVRVSLLLAGFFVGVGTEVGEKAETTLASNFLQMIERPLDQHWLERVRISRNGAPMTRQTYCQAPISDADFKRLEACPQFRNTSR